MKVLLTGASGFIGRYVLDQLLISGHEVIAVTHRSDTEGRTDAVQWLRADLLDPSQLTLLMQDTRPQGLVHLAWYAKHGHFWDAAENFDWCRATARLLEAFHTAGGKKIVVAGTCAEYDVSQGVLIEDKTPTNPMTIYGKCKNVTRQYLEEYCKLHSFDYVWARLFFPYGPGEPPTKLIPSVLNALALASPVICTHPQQLRDYIHAKDAAIALVHLLNQKQICGVFNIGSGQPSKLADIVKICTEAFAQPSKVLFGETTVSAENPPVIVADNTKLRATGWQPFITLPKGISDYAELIRCSGKV